MSSSVYVHVVQTVPGFPPHAHSPERSGIRRTEVRIHCEEGGREIFVTPKESTGDESSFVFFGNDEVRAAAACTPASVRGDARLHLVVQHRDASKHTEGTGRKLSRVE